MLYVGRNHFFDVAVPVRPQAQSLLVHNTFRGSGYGVSSVGIGEDSLACGNLFLESTAYVYSDAQVVGNFFRFYYGVVGLPSPIELVTGQEQMLIGQNRVLIGSYAGSAVPPAINAVIVYNPVIWCNKLKVDTTGSPKVGVRLDSTVGAVVVGNYIVGFTGAGDSPILENATVNTQLSWPNDPTWGDNFT
jgi:hypothetical protein